MTGRARPKPDQTSARVSAILDGSLRGVLTAGGLEVPRRSDGSPRELRHRLHATHMSAGRNGESPRSEH